MNQLFKEDGRFQPARTFNGDAELEEYGYTQSHIGIGLIQARRRWIDGLEGRADRDFFQ